MKKILLLTVAAILAAAPSYAVQAITSGQTINITVGSTGSSVGPVAVTGFSKFSNKVTASILSNGSQYAITAVHVNGDKEYGTASTDGKIFWHTVTVGQATATVVSNSDTTQFTAWSSL